MLCPICKRPYGKRKRCYWCSGRKRTGEQKPCPGCGKPVYRQPYMTTAGRNEGTFCSIACKAKTQRGTELVTGTKFVRKDGYVSVKIGIRKYELEHRLKMAEKLGRPLTTGEHVHHRNGDRQDNRLRNLRLMTNTEHQALHEEMGTHQQRRSKRVTLTCKRCGAAYERKPSRVAESSYCSVACKVPAMRGPRARKIAEQRKGG